MKRPEFLSDTGNLATAGLVGGGLLASCQQPDSATDCSPTVTTGPGEVIHWKMVTSWPLNFPGLGVGANNLVESIAQLSGGQLQIKVYGANELVPAYEVFDAVSRGTVEVGHSSPYYWKGIAPAAQFFGGIPFGMTSEEQNGWLYHGGGLELWQELYARFNLTAFPAGNTGTQMGGWFNKEINSLDDLQGLKMRIPGLGGEVIKRAGATPQSIPGGEIFTALQTGTIDASEWVGPYNDLAFGLFRAGKFYYYPGWHEPGTTLEALFNKEAFEQLPEQLQAVVEVACQAANMDMLSDFNARNGQALRTLVDEHGVQLREFPPAVIKRLKQLTDEILDEMAADDEHFSRIYAAYRAFQKTSRYGTQTSVLSYLNQEL